MHLPATQAFLGKQVGDALGQKLGTQVNVGRINVGMLNRIIIDDIMLKDQKGDSMIYATRASAKIDIMPLVKGRISISSSQLFGLKANFYKQTAKSNTNFQFLLDSLASKDTTRHTPLDLHIGSLIIRHGSINYHQRDIAPQAGVFSPQHLSISNLSAHVILNHLTDNSVNVTVKKIALQEKSGLNLRQLHFKLIADKKNALLTDFAIILPHTELTLGNISASYFLKQNNKVDLSSLTFKGSINQSKITLSDIACFVPIFRTFSDPIYTSLTFSGEKKSAHISSFNFRTGSGGINLQAKGDINYKDNTLGWQSDIDNLHLTAEGIKLLANNLGKRIKIPHEILRLGELHYHGMLGGKGTYLTSHGMLETEAGDASIEIEKRDKYIKAHINSKDINVGRILANKQLGTLATLIDIEGTQDHFTAKGIIDRFDFNQYSYRNINLDGSYIRGDIEGKASINDPNIGLKIEGNYSINSKLYQITAQLDHLLPSILGLKVVDNNYRLNNISLNAHNQNEESSLDLEAPFIDIHARGQYDITTIHKSIVNFIAEKLPTLPSIKKQQLKTFNDFTLQANVTSTEPLRRILGIPLDVASTIHINGNVSDKDKDLNLVATLPEFSYNGSKFHGGDIELTTAGETLFMDARISQGSIYDRAPSYRLRASVANNELNALLDYNNHSRKLPIKGQVDAKTQFFKTRHGDTGVHVSFMPSDIQIGDTIWNIQHSDIVYEKNNIDIDHFAISHGKQHVIVSGKATADANDSIVADLKDVDVAYILNLINFHSVDFAGYASGKAVIKSAFKSPDAYAHLNVSQFKFENGDLGTLHANVNYNKEEEQIDINAIADDGPAHQTLINGYVSPKRNYIDLGIRAEGTSLGFMESFCGSFMDNIQAWAYGKLNIVGDLKNINLVGDVVAKGSLHMRQLNTDYTFTHLRAHAIPNDIQFMGDSIFDRNYNHAILNGGIHHQHLTRLSYDIDIDADNLLAYDRHEFGDDTFYGTVYATGKCSIHGKSGETIIDINATPQPGTEFVYNAASPDAIGDKSFIHWAEHKNMTRYDEEQEEEKEKEQSIPSDMRINFLVNTNQNLTLKLLMDERTGDYIALNGDGVIRASYFNKGAFEMFGNYLVDHGTYKLTIQNIIKKDFTFQPGGTITFGGNPYNAPIHLQAKYTVNGVPLSDLNIGRSFSNNNIRVDCLMDITGTPASPKVEFSMDMPTVNSDAKQMIYSLINSQEEMNQQVLYLLGVGRFYAQSNNNQASENAAQQSQTSLAMQSILSGTISQQISNVLSSFVNNNNWSLGANISTGDEGFNNAEYEGILSGRMLNNRLLFNGQFGYRDNAANTTQSFIGDFDLRYLIFPNGDFSVRMYNQTNDRYFTRNSLNTQGVGFIIKRDFSGWRDFWGIKKSKKKKSQKNKTAH